MRASSWSLSRLAPGSVQQIAQGLSDRKVAAAYRGRIDGRFPWGWS
ncbi:hypothetical protein [Streptomyces sp. NPDC088350]